VDQPAGAPCHTAGEREHAAVEGERERACTAASAPVRPSMAEEEGSIEAALRDASRCGPTCQPARPAESPSLVLNN
jgi:hypothetical protein